VTRPRHPDAEGRERRCTPDEACITCGDVAVSLRVLEVDEERGLALCEDTEGRRESVEVALVLPVAAGDELLVHAGTALARMGDAHALRR
jgi:hydrogenase maturation factor